MFEFESRGHKLSFDSKGDEASSIFSKYLFDDRQCVFGSQNALKLGTTRDSVELCVFRYSHMEHSI